MKLSSSPKSPKSRQVPFSNKERKLQEKDRLLLKQNATPATPPPGNSLAISLALMTVFALANRIFQKLQTIPMYNYPFFLNILTTAIYVPICYAYIIPMLMFGKQITKEQTSIPKYKFFVMGFYDSISSAMQIFAVNYITNASMIVLLQQSAIPISMFISRVFLKAQYKKSQYTGAFIVLLGIAVVLTPRFFSPSSSADSSSSDNMVQFFWWSMVILSCIPSCLSNVYKEKALGESDIDVVYLNGWVSLFQLLCCIPLAPPSAYASHIKLSEVPQNLVNGMKCYLGQNSIFLPDDVSTMYNNATFLSSTTPIHPDNCASAPIYVTIYLGLNLVYNLLIVYILKHGSANILWLASTVNVPLTNVAFSLKFIPGNKPLQGADIGGLVVIMSGLVFYRFFDKLTFWFKTRKLVPSEAEKKDMEDAGRVGLQVQRRVLTFTGFNQMESLEPILDSEVRLAQKAKMIRTPAQIRSAFMMKLGMSPSPDWPHEKSPIRSGYSSINNNV